MSKTHRWKNVSVPFTVELSREYDGVPWEDLTYEKELPVPVLVEINSLVPTDCESLELDFDITSSGYHQPKSMYGGPDHLGWPEEGEDERIVHGVSIIVEGKPVKLSKESQDLLEELYREQIDAADLPAEQDGPDPDEEYERWKDGD